MMTSSHPSAQNWQSTLRGFLDVQVKRPLIVVLGPTASGKTGFSILLAHQLGKEGLKPEIVNADSRQVYEFLDIGTAKITQPEMERVPHHLLSVLDPKEELTIAKYQKDAMAAIDEIHSRGGLPILVGGSMLYLSAIIDGLQPVSSSDPAVRERLSREYDADAGVTLMKRLKEVDPQSAAGIPRQNKVYVLRALEIFESTGTPKSSQLKRSSCQYDLLIFGIDRDRMELNERIDARTKHMLDSGWIDEVKALKDRGYGAADPGMKSHGYREIFEYLERGGDVEELSDKISLNVRHYAKRQRTWWKGDERISWIKPSEPANG